MVYGGWLVDSSHRLYPVINNMTKKISASSFLLRQLLWGLEAIFTLVVPIYLYGWLLGLLIHSGLSSLLHIAGLLSGNMPRYVVVKGDEILDDQADILKEANQS